MHLRVRKLLFGVRGHMLTPPTPERAAAATDRAPAPHTGHVRHSHAPYCPVGWFRMWSVWRIARLEPADAPTRSGVIVWGKSSNANPTKPRTSSCCNRRNTRTSYGRCTAFSCSFRRVSNSGTTFSQKCEAAPKRARI